MGAVGLGLGLEAKPAPGPLPLPISPISDVIGRGCCRWGEMGRVDRVGVVVLGLLVLGRVVLIILLGVVRVVVVLLRTVVVVGVGIGMFLVMGTIGMVSHRKCEKAIRNLNQIT